MKAAVKFLILFLACSVCVSARAGSIVNLLLVPDGSADPPGDRIDVSLLFGPGETAGTCEVRAYTLGSDRFETRAIRSRNKGHADKSGFLLLTQPVARRDGGATDFQIVVPYGDLDLSPGTYKIGYELTITGLGAQSIQRATNATMMIVTDETRTHMTVPTLQLRSTNEVQKQTGIVGASRRPRRPSWTSRISGCR